MFEWPPITLIVVILTSSLLLRDLPIQFGLTIFGFRNCSGIDAETITVFYTFPQISASYQSHATAFALLAWLKLLTMAKMEGEMITLHYVMAVELAIEREIAYRKKMEVSKNLCQNLEPLLPLQVPPSSRVGLKRKEPSRSIQAFLTKQPSSGVQTFHKRSKGFVCKACQMDFSTVSHLKQHSETPRHTGHILGMKRRGQNVSTPFMCKLCDSSCSSAFVMENHINGMKHAASLQEFENAKKARDEVFAAYR